MTRFAQLLYPLLTVGLLAVLGGPAEGRCTQGIRVERFSTNPLLSVANVGRPTAQNLDRPGSAPPFVSFAGPSVIRVPSWLPDFPGQYAMYFAHHKGGHIRLAYADDPKGPWLIESAGRGVLRLADLDGVVEDHIASPDVHVDHAREEILMYFHGPRAGAVFDQRSFLAASKDGLSFELVTEELLGAPYFRVAHWRGHALTPGRLGPFARSRDGVTNFETGPALFDNRTRHYALVTWNERLFVFYSRRNDGPERIRLRTINLFDPLFPEVGRDWDRWALSAPRDVLFPTEPYEMLGGARALDPNVFFDDDGRAYLFYSGGHEQTIAGAELFLDEWQGLGIRDIRCASGKGVGLASRGAGLGARPWLGTDAAILSSPAALEGGRVIQTSPADVRSHEESTHFLRFSVSAPCTVYVAHDSLMTRIPAWLSGWTATGQSLVLEDPRGAGHAHRTLNIYSKSVTPGCVALGGNLPAEEPFGADRAMYVVVCGR